MTDGSGLDNETWEDLHTCASDLVCNLIKVISGDERGLNCVGGKREILGILIDERINSCRGQDVVQGII